MQLNAVNIEQWKSELNELAKPHFGDNFADTQSDEDWLTDNLGDTPQDVLDENLSADY